MRRLSLVGSVFMCLLDVKHGFISQDRHQNEIWKKSLRRFLARTLRVNKPARKNFSKNLLFGVDAELQVQPLTYKINAHNIGRYPDWSFVMANYVCMLRRRIEGFFLIQMWNLFYFMSAKPVWQINWKCFYIYSTGLLGLRPRFKPQFRHLQLNEVWRKKYFFGDFLPVDFWQ